MDEQEFDLGVFDLQLPDMDGLEVAQLARDRGVTMPFIALTAHGEPSYRSRALAAGLNDFLVKPVPSEDLLQAVCRALTGGSAEGADAPLDSH
jgi:DNA-binding response OmpR family regulator